MSFEGEATFDHRLAMLLSAQLTVKMKAKDLRSHIFGRTFARSDLAGLFYTEPLSHRSGAPG